MDILTYVFIFISKIIENALATLRVIVISNGKKVLGSILQLCISLVWIIVTGTVVINLKQDPLKILFFCLGSFVGSFIGSQIEEKMALGDSLVTCITANDKNMLYKTLDRKGYNLTKIKGEKNNAPRDILLVAVPRQKKHHVIDIINDYDDKATIISEMANITK